ncbi:MAG: large conductance mechanosensitive channel protein MscL [Ruminococcaceae bacterium]|nr:large conductance mechanosensitive channel protein MscL [Oscillospiraceae bacterium]MBQ8323538.1 large conductance mechanosensitive channel protein MscL [Clostridia bacterium]
MAKKNKSGFFTDFKKFITKGNILDMAVGMIIGTAFNQIVKSLVDHILMPVIGNLCDTQDLVDLKYVLTPAELAEDGVTVLTPEVAISYGLFLSYVINFFIVAMTLFIIIRSAMKFQQKMESLRKEEEEAAAEPPAPPAPPEPTVEEKTLAVLNEIKTLLNEKK